MSNTVSIHRDNSDDDSTISSLVVKLSEKVGKHGSDIEKLKEETGKLDRLEKEVDAVASETVLIRQEVKQLTEVVKDSNLNTSKFRYTLWTVVGLIFGCMFGTLKFGLDITEKSQATLHENLQKQISDGDKRHTDNLKDIALQIGDLRKFLIEEKRPK